MNEELFSGKAEVYRKFRSEYPNIFLDYLYSQVGFSPESVVADIGAGTGMLSKCFLERGSRIICVEPNQDMLETARQELGANKRCTFIKAPAEETTIPETSVDFVTAARAFHWFNAERFKAECQRILKPGGKVVLIWNNNEIPDEVKEETAVISRKYCPKFEKLPNKDKKTAEDFAAFFKDGNYEHKEFRAEENLSEAVFIGRYLSRSYAPQEGTQQYTDFSDGLGEIFSRYAKQGNLAAVNRTECYYGNV